MFFRTALALAFEKHCLFLERLEFAPAHRFAVFNEDAFEAVHPESAAPSVVLVHPTAVAFFQLFDEG